MMDPGADENVLDFLNEDEVSGSYALNAFAYLPQYFRILSLMCLWRNMLVILVPFLCKVGG